MATRTSTGAKIYISSTNVADTVDSKTEFEALTWTLIDQVIDMGEYGDESGTIEVSYLNRGRKEGYKGIRDGGTMALQVGHEPTDPGQIKLKAAEASPFNYGFKITLDDAGSGSPSSPSTDYFRGKVLGRRKSIGGADQVITRTFQVKVNSDLLEIDPV